MTLIPKVEAGGRDLLRLGSKWGLAGGLGAVKTEEESRRTTKSSLLNSVEKP